ncbi:MAG TPA: hypothetical protein VEY11_15595 [Pyrinomonadaceae bacterium]|nr:hypothetical protein [Pyrinomonadaceae bacterium]
MIVKNFATVALLASTLAVSANMCAAQEDEKSGVESARRVFTIGYGFTREEEDALKARARQCIWENWRLKRPALCAVVRTNIEGELTTHSFQLNRGAGGQWQVFLEVSRECCWHDAPEAKKLKTDGAGAHIYRIVERVDAKSKQVVPAEQDRRPDTYVLRFREDAAVRDDAPALRFL